MRGCPAILTLMPLEKCTKDGESGWRFGPQGTCFVGKNGRARAVAQGAAINASRAARGESTEKLAQEAAVFAAGLDDQQLADFLADVALHYLGALEVQPTDTELTPDKKKGKFSRKRPDPKEKVEAQTVKKIDEEQRIVWAEVYIPDILDSHGDFMTPSEIEKMAHDFLASGKVGEVDVNHDNDVTRGNVLVESFIARDDDTLFLPGAWVAAVHCPDDEMWERVKSGEINGFSMQAKVFMRPKEIEIDVPPEVRGVTMKAEGTDEGSTLHEHEYMVGFGEDGAFQGGETLPDATGHIHRIKRGTVTEGGPKDGHTHRFSVTDALLRPDPPAA